MDASIAIVNWNTCDLLDQCLRSLYETSTGFDFETIVVDNASEDESVSMVKAKYPNVHLIQNKVNLGFATGCNIAFKHSQGRYFILLNSDTIVLENALGKLVEFMNSHRRVGVTGCRLLNQDGTLQRSASCYPDLLTELFDALYLSKLFPQSRLFGRYAMTYWDFEDTREVDFVGGSCMIVRRDAIEEVGLLDEDYFMYTEEADWCYRFFMHDWKIYYYPKARIIHLGGQSSNRYGNDILVHLYSSRNRFISKHYGHMAAAMHKSIIVLGAVLRLPIFEAMKLMKKGDPNGSSFQIKLLKWAFQGIQCESGRNGATECG